jgi:biopolymer transport protein ExbB/TolQ
MPHKGYTWSDEYRERFYSSDAVKQHMAKFIALASQNKPNSQRIKMAQAKVGRKYTEQHKTNMSEAQKFRQALKKDIEATHPDLASDEVWALVRQQCEALK